MLIYFFMFVMFFSGLLSFGVKRKHLLLMLLSLEFIVLAIFMLLLFYLNMNFDFFFSMVFITFSVCEGALGLSLLVSLMRTHGNDYFSSMTFLC
nr:NADH dehydrogenase subunit 4L [Metoecus cf. javanus JL-2021a]